MLMSRENNQVNRIPTLDFSTCIVVAHEVLSITKVSVKISHVNMMYVLFSLNAYIFISHGDVIVSLE